LCWASRALPREYDDMKFREIRKPISRTSEIFISVS
jgi:hypothetical protein